MLKFKEEVLQAALEGSVRVDDAERLIKLAQDQINAYSQHGVARIKMSDNPIEAARIYQELMR
ncbi:hypothetical protein BH10PSE19_BH10PSE19_19890 [soil metagenome]